MNIEAFENISKQINDNLNLFSQQIELKYNSLKSAWAGHIPFAFDLVKNIHPKIIVELGTHYGDSYFAFCQSIKTYGLNTICYAIDTWEGDKHTGKYSNEVFEQVDRHNTENYNHFSYLIRDTFDNAAVNFDDSSVDLLHIDGLHTYEAVKHDFETWENKVKPGGIILFHDIAVRHKDFGVWKFWDEIKTNFDETFEFYHSAGLGIARKPTNAPHINYFLNTLFCKQNPISSLIRYFYINQAEIITQKNALKTIKETHDNLLANNKGLSDNTEILNAKNKELSDNAEILNAKNKALSDNAEILNAKNKELRDRIEAMKNSSSWKLTKPLRWIKQKFIINLIGN